MNDLKIKIQTAFAQQHTNNSKTRNNINVINQLLASNQKVEQVIEQLKHWQDDPSLNIQNHTFWFFICVGICLIIPALMVHPAFVIAAALSFTLAFFKRTSTKALKNMIGFAQQRNLEHKYQFLFNYNDENLDIDSPYRFPYFTLGNNDNDIRNCIYGRWQVNGIEYPYMLFNYHYVDKEESRDSDGKKKTEYQHYDLWGIILENFPVQGISISSKQKRASRLGVKWSSGDIRFDDQYQISGIDEIRLAKFFSPSHVLILDQAMDHFDGDLYIQSDRASLCWLFDVDILKRQTQFDDIETVYDLATQLETMNMPEYESLKQSLTTILQKMQ